MTDMITISREELEHLKERAAKSSMDKSYLQLVIRLMNRVSAVSGLEDTVDCMLRNILDVIGGANIILYYFIDSDIFSADAYGKRLRLDTIDDDLVQRVIVTKEPVEAEHPFSDTMMQTPEFTKAYTWVYPLLVGPDLVGVFKMESLHIGVRDLYQYLPTFFSFVALVLKNEILGESRLKQAYDQLSEINEELELEVAERELIENELRTARDELEDKVAKRTFELREANEHLQLELDERIKAQEALRRYSEEVEDLYNRAPCGYHSLDMSGNFVRINDTELEWLGYKREEIVGVKNFNDLLSEKSREGFRENFPIFKAQGWIKDLEFEMVRKDGSTFPVLVSATAIKDKNGIPVISRSTMFDVTDRQKISASEHLLSAIVESSDDAIMSKDMDEIILSWNRGAERIYGYAAEEIIGCSIMLLVPPDRIKEIDDIMTALKHGERIEHFTTERLRKNGERIFVSLTVSPIRDSAGDVVSASIISRNISEQVRLANELQTQRTNQEELIRKRTEELLERSSELQDNQQALMNIVDDLNQKTDELEQANAKLMELDRLKSMFIASMSHELRTPLNSIIGFSSILCDEWLGPVNQEQKENLAIILRSGKHLLTLINDVIDVSKIEAGKIEVKNEEFDLFDLMTEGIQYLEKDIKEKQLELQTHLRHLLIYSDRRRLLQCFINLLSNALKFTEYGSIAVEVASECGDTGEGTGQVMISVRDTGIGIVPEDIPRLFQPFVRLDSPMKATVPGTGLGLYLTRKLVGEVLNGDILCASEIGKGSTFTISIPERIDAKGTGNRR
ncbi:non-motile and phage-resistance protein [Geobacter sp. OR-1]|uniref:PAS domain S-box protein n=1 Tax=Geobacter sp. OR-1 TaxID=1266765 RepID=UPI00054282A9|nr:PAS domain S-box protein [Geobacter sp. OR-1]GAM10799.1 non-motile and phage-resistance protein [Geobacter sp. OR-1]